MSSGNSRHSRRAELSVKRSEFSTGFGASAWYSEIQRVRVRHTNLNP